MSTSRVLITGGLGFIGSHHAARLITAGRSVTVLDSLARPGAGLNRDFLASHRAAGRLSIVPGDVRDADLVRELVAASDIVVHLAAQVAVTTSVADPVADFDVNARGTLNVLEAARQARQPPLVIYSSTNKVYGALDALGIDEGPSRYTCPSLPDGVGEDQPLDFHSPYGCSKGAAEQYVHDYARVYGVPTVVLRMSCIYGPRQFGIGDQGWVGWLVARTVLDRELHVYGDGKQVRDLLHVDDLCALFDRIAEHRTAACGRIFNVGGGMANSLAVWTELGPMLAALAGRAPRVSFHDWRPGDQRYYVSDIARVRAALGWAPRVPVQEGVRQLYDWALAHRALFDDSSLAGAYR